ncbi:hypothetical protein [Sphaerimonospora thailandensis]|uniref:Uncharacterized protein n=1 Tax=Sphaerimonospora thailandensis TaxID=795644 RepID=A0A8J3W1Z8_9ACTN|nr:hypothetical protein [Sphaerimonospora thailandensis]GIH72770.1 hypothetical protein Mth01_50230 [Sphaerimonospora thailandensis]
MFDVIHWRGYLRVNKHAGAGRVIARMGKAAGEPFTLLSCESYWKMPELAEVRMSSPLGAQEPQEAVFHTLLTAQRIANPWSVTCNIGDDRLDLEGIAAKTASARFTVPGVDWLLFSVTADEPGSGPCRPEREQTA